MAQDKDRAKYPTEVIENILDGVSRSPQTIKNRHDLAHAYGDCLFPAMYRHKYVRAAFIYHGADAFLASWAYREHIQQIHNNETKKAKRSVGSHLLAHVVRGLMYRTLVYSNSAEIILNRQLCQGMPKHGIPSFGTTMSETQVRAALNVLLDTKIIFMVKHEKSFNHGNTVILNLPRIIIATLDAYTNEFEEYDSQYDLAYEQVSDHRNQSSVVNAALNELTMARNWLSECYYLHELEYVLDNQVIDQTIEIPAEMTLQDFLREAWIPTCIGLHENAKNRYNEYIGSEPHPMSVEQYCKMHKIKLPKNIKADRADMISKLERDLNNAMGW